ncbi:MAG: hypothetical protein HOC20_04905 [Chloroflexi bacterium]|jgi:hypothetical protein|nr:hypothetical protein [Chloroflexota bacterium]
MSKVKAKIISIGHLPADIDLTKIASWKSGLFELSDVIEHYELRCDSDTDDWEYSDANICTQLPERGIEDLLVALVNVPLENNYYLRRVQNNMLVITFYEIADSLRQNRIPLENVVLRSLYACSLVHRRNSGHIPEMWELSKFTHDETRGCIYDMTGVKEEIAFSCVKPIICSECYERSVREKVSRTTLDEARSELTKINKQLFYQITDLVKAHPIIAIIVSSIWAILLSCIGSLLGNLLF